MTIISSEERKQLLSHHKKERDGRIKDRLKVVLWSNEGKTIDEISQLLYLSPQTIKCQISEYKEAKKLKPSNGGSNPKLS